MKWITSSVTGMARGHNGVIDHFNHPVNLDFVERITTNDYEPTGDNAKYSVNQYALIFHMSKDESTWLYPDKLTRDNRLAEILQYVGAKTF
jgi:hypothetical protein